ncbi:TPA: hypothetical protein ACINVJ_001548, partial [Streptococcus agalactiae]
KVKILLFVIFFRLIISHFPTIKERNCIEIAFISINLNFFGYNRDILNTFNANNFPILYSKESRM